MGSGTVLIWNPFPPKQEVVQPVVEAKLENPTPSVPEPEVPALAPIPSARPGTAIPYLVGRQRLIQPQILWVGQPRVRTTGGQTVKASVDDGETWTYDVQGESIAGAFLSMQLGVCLGDGVRLHGLYSGEDLVIYENDAGLGPARAEVTIPANGTFVEGDIIWEGGSFDRAREPFLLDFIASGNLPAYRGMANLIIKDVNFSTFQENLQIEVSRYPNVLSLTDEVNLIGDDLNPASALADWLTNGWGGLGLSLGDIDTASFEAAAATLASEGNGISLAVGAGLRGGDVTATMLEQMDAMLVENPATGKYELKLIRFPTSGFIAAKLTADNVLDLNRTFQTGGAAIIDEMSLTYSNRANKYKSATVRGYSRQVDDFGQATEVAYPGVMNETLALAILQREFNIASRPTMTLEATANRTAAGFIPGTIVRVHVPTEGIEAFVGVVGRLRKHDMKSNSVTVTVTQIHNPGVALGFSADEGVGQLPDLAATPPETGMLKQTPYWIARFGGLQITDAINGNKTSPWLPLMKPYNEFQQSFKMRITNWPDLGNADTTVTDGFYCSTGTLAAAIGKYDAIDTGEIASITLNGASDHYGLLTSPGEEGVRNGQFLVFIDDEILSFESFTDNADGTFTLGTVHRALLDTAPQAHASGANVFILHNGAFAATSTERMQQLDAVILNFEVASKTGFRTGRFADDPFQISASAAYSRPSQPYRPHDAKLNGLDRSSMLTNELDGIGALLAQGETFNMTWKTRSRLEFPVALQADAAEDGEDAACFYKVYITDSNGAQKLCGTTATGTAINGITGATVPADTALGEGTLWVEYVRADGTEYSRFRDELPVTILNDVYGPEDDATEVYSSEDGLYYYIAE